MFRRLLAAIWAKNGSGGLQEGITWWRKEGDGMEEGLVGFGP